ncbi:type IV toxin-antitoxin system AbiEi family antitoxin [Lacisediminihabitans changchengi]|uniref:AbiEi antitoxin C-terminal domain-containing protein n=1 Tax=Lacisediminihabitans changchengi TaxID=2787634 RepID=A0A934SK31_9MICO|nr:type IV toxin-antitoxin system AbiEi family antitoxin [Lacisediminihabitans changchengi]MBK4346765.1 hypothetical protein [Lacisediminihabitans changchengi]MBK4348112.1 hypothetical protein [Lacisediminihabitans changchengi]
MRLASVLSPADLPSAELQAARLDGELYRVDECFSPIDQPTGLHHRALALAAITPRRLIAELHSAAWVWGALDQPPSRHRLCADITARTRPPIGPAILREVVVDATDVVTLGPLRITTPLRTAVDLARLDPEPHREVITRLFAIGGFGLADCEALIQRRRNLPDKRRALRRLQQAQPPVTR